MNRASQSSQATIPRQEIRELVRAQLQNLIAQDNLAGVKSLLAPVHIMSD